MSKKNDLPEEAGKVNWSRLESYSKKKDKKAKKKKAEDDTLVKAVAQNLSEEEKASPYPDDFLAEINIMRNDIDGSGIDLNELDEDQGEEPDVEEDEPKAWLGLTHER